MIYVLDQPSSELRSFHADGRSGKVLARRGSGPGELDNVRAIVVGGDTIFLSARNIQAIDTSGKYILASAPHLAESVPYAASFFFTEAGLQFHRIRHEEETEDYVDRKIERYQIALPDRVTPLTPFMERHYRYGERFIWPTILSPGVVWTPDRAGRTYFVVGDSFHINVVGANDSLEWSILGNVPRVNVASSDVKDFGESLLQTVYELDGSRETLPPFSEGPVLKRRPVIGQMLVNAQGYMLVQRWDVSPRPYAQYAPGGKMHWLLLDGVGTPVASFALPAMLRVKSFRGCKVYGSMTLDDGTQVVQVYSLPKCTE